MSPLYFFLLMLENLFLDEETVEWNGTVFSPTVYHALCEGSGEINCIL